MDKLFTIVGSVAAGLAVAAGAFGAHGLRATFELQPELEQTFRTAVQYHLYHALALLFLAWASARWADPLINWAGGLLALGIVLFSGSLYLLVLTKVRSLGAVTPFGGAAFLVGWALLAIAVLRS